jgi:hypothetical protein
MSTTAEQIAILQAEVATLLNQTIPALQQQIALTSTGADDMWVILCAVLVFLMQGGFAMLEVGAVREKNVTVSLSLLRCSFLLLLTAFRTPSEHPLQECCGCCHRDSALVVAWVWICFW